MKTYYQLIARSKLTDEEHIAFESRSLNANIKEKDKLKKYDNNWKFYIIKITEEKIKL